CGTMIKDYGHALGEDPAWRDRAARVAALAVDVSEVIGRLGLPPAAAAPGLRVAYHSACSLRNGQGIEALPKALLAAAGFAVEDVPEGHLCCGSAGTYNLLQPALADALLERKAGHLARLAPQAVAAGNVGCIAQLR